MLKAALEENPLGGLMAVFVLYIGYLALRLTSQDTNSTPNYAHKAYETVQNKILGIMYLFAGADMIERNYDKACLMLKVLYTDGSYDLQAKGKPFLIQTPGRQNIMVTSSRHIKELNEAPRHQLSLHAVAKDFLQPKHTMQGFEWKDQRGVEGTGFVRALRNLLTSHLPGVLPNLSASIADQFESELTKHKIIDGYHMSPLFATAKKLVVRANCVVFFGPELSQNHEFFEAALRFPEEVFIAAEVLRIMPGSIARFIASLVTKNHRFSTVMHTLLYPTVEQRLEIRRNQGLYPQHEKPCDGIQWLLETSPSTAGWNADRLIGEIMGVWYGSVHTLALATTYALTDLYSHEEYIEPLRNEVQGDEFDEFQKTSNGLPLIDSFLKESARMNPFDSSLRRQALLPFTFSDGLHIPSGDWVCIPTRSIMHDSQHFSNPLEFDGFRFLLGRSSREPGIPTRPSSKLTDASDEWLLWGTSRMLCPGRFYAAVILKLIVSHLLRNYDCRLREIKGGRSRQWRATMVPKASITLCVRARGKDSSS